MIGRTRFIELARRVYGEIVRGRTRVQVINEASDETQTIPRFLLSPYRSGTTLFRYCMDSHPRIAGPPETDYLAPLMSLLDDEPSMTGLQDLGFSSELVEAKLSRFARSFLDTYAAGRNASDGWVDKSPRYAENPQPLRRLFPDARFVVMHRHPLDQIHSFTKGGTFGHPTLNTDATGKDLLIKAAHYWRDLTQGLSRFSRDSNDCLTITYEDLSLKPRDTLESVLAHYELPWDDAVINFHEHDHDLGRQSGRISGTTDFSIAQGKWRSWPDDHISAVWDVVQGSATILGYELPPKLEASARSGPIING